MLRLLSLVALLALNSGRVSAHPMNDMTAHHMQEGTVRPQNGVLTARDMMAFPAFPVGPNVEAVPPSPIPARFIKDADYGDSTAPAASNPAIPASAPPADPARRDVPAAPAAPASGHVQLGKEGADVPPKGLPAAPAVRAAPFPDGLPVDGVVPAVPRAEALPALPGLPGLPGLPVGR